MKILIESMMLKFRTASAAAGRVCTLAGSARLRQRLCLRAHKTKYALLSVLQCDAAIFQTVSEFGQNTVDSYCSTKELLGFSQTKSYC